MEEIISLLTNILSELEEMNDKIDSLTSCGVYGISDLYTQISDATSEISDVKSEISDVKSEVSDVKSEVCESLDSLKGGIYDMNDIHRRLEEIRDNIN